MNMVSRTFYSVGNGLFTFEQNDYCCSVYDCGGENLKTIQNALKRMPITKGCTITILFISHYDNDHVNGLRDLLNDYNVKKVILPMLTPLEKFILSSKSGLLKSTQSLINNPYDFITEISPETKVVYVEDDDEEQRRNNEPIDIGRLNKTLASGTPILVGNWQYIAYNIKSLKISDVLKFYNGLGFLVTPSMQDVINKLKGLDPNNLKRIIKGILTKDEIQRYNDYCMTVWSGPILNSHDGCLYTGDYNAKKNFARLYSAYKSQWCNTSIVQIPHHGSKYNYHQSLSSPCFKNVISASAGPYQSKKIVNPNDVINILNNNGLPYFATNKNGDVILYASDKVN
jgi:hypothetical protein